MFWDNTTDVNLMSYSQAHIDLCIPEMEVKGGDSLVYMEIQTIHKDITFGRDSLEWWIGRGNGTIGKDVTNVCLEVLNKGRRMDDINSMVITLIPKMQSPRSMGVYRPISLCNVISEAQCAFIPGRLISDNTIVDFECLSRIKRRKRKIGSMAIKLDMSKAYDRVEWGFIEQMMGKMGFSEKWRQLIWNCISTVSYSYRLNREVCGNIKPMRGLRQSDPLSPYLFIICAEGLSCLIRGAQEKGEIMGFKLSRYGPIIMHLFFTDDSLLFTRANLSNCEAIKRVLRIYSEASGQLVNFSKSTICVSLSVGMEESRKLVDMVGMKLVDCHERYLGLPRFLGRSKRNLFTDIVDKVWNRIKGWGEKLLSIGGKAILIKVVVQAVPFYAMSIFRLPKSLFDEIRRLMDRFWWGGNERNRKLHLCKWQQLCKPKLERGLGF
ncbi:hypothetical protein Ddye_004444 [Dipteronia dyeriana]|uniref:Reverse transcriptase domain-containing protein n=1 Tax=Dipteronia dyeriana TaxID=168575 RepID=A0AAD9XUY8_9ROSI|nr:hypothetical protein Ddye_004444 [Dipteronia dyeriana]